MRLTDETGNKYGRLRVVKRAPDIGPNGGGKLATWNCVCECGKTVVVTGVKLRRGHTRSCGCLKDESDAANRLPPGQAGRNKLIWSYRRHAKDNNRSYELSLSEFEKLTSSNCHYCNAKPSMSIKSVRGNGAYIYNGIDRKDNEIGYVISNCVPCCKMCNFSKRNYDMTVFLDWVKRVHDHLIAVA